MTGRIGMRQTLIGLGVVLLALVLTPLHPAQAQSTAAPIVYVVQWGDALWKIAARYGVTQDAIVIANQLASPNQIYAGQQLVIPAATGGPIASAPGGVHTVQRGETLYRISVAYGVSQQSIIAANNLINPSHIEVGQRLTIPGTTTVPAPSTETPDPPQSPGPGTHVVQRGETLNSIARLYNTSWPALAQANSIANPSLVYVGQVLSIPAPGTTLPAPQPTSPEGKQIVVDLSEQRLYAYQDGTLLNTFVVSTGVAAYPTVVGDFSIYLRYSSQRMIGPGYDLPGVPWVMYFYQGYGLHGTYWHNNFGTPMSHGCVNMKTDEAKWLYDWAENGTPVHVQY